MTHKFKYDPEQHCLREVARPRDTYPPSFKWQRHAEAEYQNHLASLRVIPCAPGTTWTEGELREQHDFLWGVGFLTGFVLPITPQPRLYTQEEADEIYMRGWSDSNKFKSSNEAFVNPRSHFAKQYFKTRFNVELTPQTPNQ